MLIFFAETMWVNTHIFFNKNIRILYFESAKTVNEMTLNELVKLTILWTIGPWSSLKDVGVRTTFGSLSASTSYGDYVEKEEISSW